MNNPSLGRPYRYEVDAALQALENEEALRNAAALKVARDMGHIRGPFLLVSRPKAHINGWRLLGAFLAVAALAALVGFVLVLKGGN